MLEASKSPVRMNSTGANPINLSGLPVELLHVIVSYTDFHTLRHLSVTNRLFRLLCAPILFEKLSIDSTAAGLHHMVQASKSWIAPFVKEITYEAAEMVDPRKSLC